MDPTTSGMYAAGDPDTSRQAAAEHLASGANAAQRAAVLAALRERPGMTSDEIARAAGIDRHAAARRCPELEREGLIRRGEPRPSTLTNRPGVTWWPT